MYNVAQSITTPLSLAALALLIFSAVFTGIIKSKNRRDIPLLKEMVRYTFALGLVLGVSAIAAFVYTKVIDTDYRVSGNIIDDVDNSPIEDALVNIPGDSSQNTREDGGFLFTLPRARFAGGYTINVSSSEYFPFSAQVTTGFTDPHTIRLKRKPRDASIFDRVLNLNVGHWIGRPTLQVEFSLNNQNDATVGVKSISASVQNNNGSARKFTSMQVMGVIPPQSTQTLYLHMNRPVRITGNLFEPDDNFLHLSARVTDWATLHPSSLDPTQSIDRLEPGIVADLQRSAEQDFFWTAGKWELELEFTCTDRVRMYRFSFEITQAQIDRMKINISQYRYGFGVLNALLLAGNGPDRGVVHIDRISPL